MAKLRCPFCGFHGAELDAAMMRSGVAISKSVSCKNPNCTAYDDVSTADSIGMQNDTRE